MVLGDDFTTYNCCTLPSGQTRQPNLTTAWTIHMNSLLACTIVWIARWSSSRSSTWEEVWEASLAMEANRAIKSIIHYHPPSLLPGCNDRLRGEGLQTTDQCKYSDSMQPTAPFYHGDYFLWTFQSQFRNFPWNKTEKGFFSKVYLKSGPRLLTQELVEAVLAVVQFLYLSVTVCDWGWSIGLDLDVTLQESLL